MRSAYAVIMAGGGGTRLWPLSRRQHPKHMLPLFAETSLYQATVARLAPLFPPERVLVVTTVDQVDALRRQTPQIPADNFLLEPEPKGTAAVVGLAAARLMATDPDARMAVFPADHFIREEARFLAVVQAALTLAQRGFLVTLGIEPTYPATGYGYIQQGEPLGEVEGCPAYRVKRFKEKPSREQAEAMLAEGGYSWNSGMFFWQVRRIWDEFQRQMPEHGRVFDALRAAWGTPQWAERLAELWPTLAVQTVDYGIMEGARDAAVIPARGLGWSDVGSWDAVWDLLPKDDAQNAAYRAWLLPIDGQGNLAYSTRERLVVLLGVDDLLVIETDDALLILPRGQSQRVRDVVKALRERGLSQYL